tara:strand:- start:1769 stop:2305 length:537 start_codon:yes stop_codon:yes gene_type:complete
MPQIKKAVEALKAGECIAYPTEGVWGLGCDPFNEEALINLRKLKNRDDTKGYILLASSLIHFNDFVDTELYKTKLMTKWPGPHTWIVETRKEANFPNLHIEKTIALRLSNQKVIVQLCSRFGGAIVSTSANLNGKKPAITIEEVRENFPGICILEGELGGLKRPTPIQNLLSGDFVRR